MRLTIARKLAVGLALLSCLGVGAMLVVYRGLATVQEAMRQLAEWREPASTASHEMEINLNEIALAVHRYVDTADPAALERIESDTADFERFLARYRELARTDTERSFGAALGAEFARFEELAGVLIEAKERQDAAFRIAGEGFEQIDASLDGYQSVAVDLATTTFSPKLFLTLDLEADLAEVGVWLANFQRTHSPEHRALIEANQQEFRLALTRFKELSLTPDEQEWARTLEATFDRTIALVREIVALDDTLRTQSGAFDRLGATLDDLLDEQVQAVAYQALYAPRREADRATERVTHALRLLIPLFFLSALAIGFLLVRLTTEPLKRLVRGTAAISEGNLSYRVTKVTRDELGDLAEHFNRMVARLEATTVSKERLEASEADLRATVEDLLREMAERLRAEAEQTRLQESLRRSETMAAMGTLVAGVAHEVRNPLFGISSTLDALEARLGPREETRRHIAVLRGEVDRLSQLTRDLLNYGRAGGAAHAPDAIAAAIDDAIAACAALGRAAGITIARHVPDGARAVVMDRAAMTQVFTNLIENAIQHSPPDGIVTVETEVEHDGQHSWLHCAVRDTGPGFRDEDLGRVFEPFFTRRRDGTGLGLSIVQRIVDEHGGRVRAANVPDGAVVTVSLPLAERQMLAG